MVEGERYAGLGAFFAPHSVALIGASDRPGSVGAAVMRNLIDGGFAGDIWPVNPRHAEVAGRRAFANCGQLPAAPDLAVICTPAAAVAGVITDCGARGTRAAVVLSAGVDAEALLAAARAHGVRVLGPNCVGLRMPRVSLNASFTAIPARAGPIALVAQSGGVITAFLEWARPRGIGLSSCISLGNAADLDAADWLEALAGDADTRAILLYLESVRDGRRFIEAAARAARSKPVFTLKVGRAGAGAAAAATHTGAMAGADNVWEAALLAAGVRRLGTLEDFYGVAGLCARLASPPDERLAIVTNSGGPAVLAVDALDAAGGAFVQLGEGTLRALDAVLPGTWSRRNPVDIIGDAAPARFVAALESVTADTAVGTTLVIHVPTDLASSSDVRATCSEFAARNGRNLVGCWIGGECDAEESVPAFATPEAAVAALVHAAAAVRLGAAAARPLQSVPVLPDLTALRAALRDERSAGAKLASQQLVESLLQAAGVPLAAVRFVPAEGDLESAADALGYPLVLKIASPDIPHKSDVGGVVTGIHDASQLRAAATDMLARCAQQRPDAHIEGFHLQRQIVAKHARELIIGISRDAQFGPVVLFGQGGTSVHVVDDSAIGIPPLDATRAAELVARTRVSRLLAAWRDWPAADMAAIEDVLVRVASLAIAVPEMLELDINPLLAHPDGVIALDARVAIA